MTSAEAYGFGPASKLHSICDGFARDDAEFHYVGTGVAHHFVNSNAEPFASVRHVRTMTELAELPATGFDAALSVMDPYLTVWASWHGIPCVFVDSLYWFWQWHPDEEDELRALAESLRAAATAEEALHRFADVPMHQGQYIAHYLSTMRCAQRAPLASRRAEEIRGLGPVEIVDAIVNTSRLEAAAPSHVLASASGLLNPLIPVDAATTWVRSVATLIKEAVERCGTRLPVIFAGNREVLELTRDLVSPSFQVVPMRHVEFLTSLNAATACLIPPGLTTMLECGAYGAPFILLPEQHYGHFANFREMIECGGADTFPEALIGTRLDVRTGADLGTGSRRLISVLDQHRRERTPVWSQMVDSVATGLAWIVDDRTRAQKAQRVALQTFAGGYSGVADIAALLAKLPDRTAA
jgi:hypothetical protein